MTTRTEHGVPDQLNVYALDVDSDVTGYGKHNRLIVLASPAERAIEVREDVRGLPLSTEPQRRAVLNGWQRQHPAGTRLTYQGSTWEGRADGRACWYHRYTY